MSLQAYAKMCAACAFLVLQASCGSIFGDDKAHVLGVLQQHATLQCSFCSLTPPKSCPCSITTSVNADLVLCLQARSSLGSGIGGSPWTPVATSLTSGVASLSDAGTSLSSSSVACHKSGVFSCLMEVSTATFGACRLCHGHAPDVVCQ